MGLPHYPLTTRHVRACNIYIARALKSAIQEQREATTRETDGLGLGYRTTQAETEPIRRLRTQFRSQVQPNTGWAESEFTSIILGNYNIPFCSKTHIQSTSENRSELGRAVGGF